MKVYCYLCMQVCFFICNWSGSRSRSPPVRNLPKPYKSKSNGLLHVCALGNNNNITLYTLHLLPLFYNLTDLFVYQVFNFMVGLLFLRLLELMGAQLLYSMLGTFCLVGVAFVKRNVMETKGKTLQEIEIALLPQEYSEI